MREVKIVSIVDGYYDSYGDDSFTMLKNDITDWETISDEDFDLLHRNLHLIARKVNDRVVIVEKDRVLVVERIKSIKEWLANEKAKQEEERRKRSEKNAELAKKKMLKKAGDERKLLEELKKKYPDA